MLRLEFMKLLFSCLLATSSGQKKKENNKKLYQIMVRVLTCLLRKGRSSPSSPFLLRYLKQVF